MKIILLTREGYEHYYVANKIASSFPLYSIIVDRGKHKSMLDKISSLYKRYSIKKLFLKIINKFFSIIWLDKYNYRKQMFNILGKGNSEAFLHKELITYVNGINTKDSIDIIKQIKPDIILIYGTSIIGKEIIQIPSKIILNMHTGISPYYRGAGCSFWPLFNNELHMLGATVHETTLNVDGGQIFSSGRIVLTFNDNIYSIFAKCVHAGTELYISTVKQIIKNSIKGENQNFTLGKEYKSDMKNWRHIITVRRKIKNGLIRDYILDNETSNRHFSTICFGGLDWWYHPRAHADMQMIKRFPKYGPTLYINSIVMQKPKFGKGAKLFSRIIQKGKSILKGLRQVEHNFWVYSPLNIPMYHIRWLEFFNKFLLQLQIKIVSKKIGIKNPIVWMVIPVAFNAVKKMRKLKLIYYKLDKYELFPNVDLDTIRNFDFKAQEYSDLTIFVSHELFNERSVHCKNPMYLDHGVDFTMFNDAYKTGVIPADIAKIKKPIVGFFGSIDKHTVDIDFIIKVAKLMPQISFVFVGPFSERYIELISVDNVYSLGAKKYEEIPVYGNSFDVAFMAWQKTDWIKSCNPIKLKEYLALGKPVVSTYFAELEKYSDVVYVANTVDEFVECVKKALKENSNKLIQKRKRKIKNETWDNKINIVLNSVFNK